ncbi:MAG TPA: hypothetical protein VHY84_10425 [Bryobacteraceae bacterium]|nr:hypothetical protein [Bryobacteraceae bacterium]
MRLVIADTGPINYLIQIGHIEILPRMFERIALPVAVQSGLCDPLAPPSVQRWVAAAPAWLEIHETAGLPQLLGLDAGETAAIALAEYLRADMLLIDLATDRGLIDFVQAISALENTTFRRPQALLEALLAKHSRRE